MEEGGQPARRGGNPTGQGTLAAVRTFREKNRTHHMTDAGPSILVLCLEK